jgi:hypothetical protein
VDQSLLYVKIKGRSQGPFSVEKLQEFVRRGQLSRMHQISADGVSWQAASTYPEIFASAAVRPVAVPQSASSGSIELAPQSVPKPTQAEQWYYAVGSDQFGPVDRAALVSMLQSGQLLPKSEVWRDGMTDWTSAESIPGLVPSRPAAAAAQSNNQLDPEVVHSLFASKSWITLVAGFGFATGSLMALMGIVAVIGGAKADSGMVVLGGIIYMAQAVITIVGAVLLMRYGSLIGEVMLYKTASHLSSAFNAQKTFWSYVGIVLIVMLAFLIVGILLSIAAAGGIPSNFRM